MMRTNNDFAMKTAIDLAKTNIESTNEWVHPEEVSYFIKEIYSLLTGEKESSEE